MLALIIDEFHTIPAGLTTSLREEGYLVELAGSRGEAMWLLEANEFDVVIHGSQAADPDGLRIVRQSTQAPILMVTHEGEVNERIAVLDAGADDVVKTPISFAEVAARLRALARRSPAAQGQELTVGSLRLDLGARLAYRCEDDGDPIELTAREFAVLELLMRHPKNVLTRTRLTEHVWGVGAFANSNVIDQLISRLRAKLERPFGVNEIMTVRGVGYRFEPDRAIRLDRAS